MHHSWIELGMEGMGASSWIELGMEGMGASQLDGARYGGDGCITVG